MSHLFKMKGPRRKSAQITAHVSQELKTKMSILAQREGVPVSTILTEVIIAYCDDTGAE
jgi:predicted DNA-binding protein